ncbi:MAG: ABC transporter ATP-binding protein [Elusimicrobiota bacterium]|nr:ABC transporter ATP-binding protein [Elusimicrobiota bacterium]
MNNVLEIKKLKYGYGARQTLKELNLTVKEGEKIGIAGPNGAGKTTLLFAIAGLIKYSGDIKVFSLDMKKSAAFARRKIGFVFENPDDQLFNLTVYEDVAFALNNRGFSDNEIQSKVKAALDKAGLSGYADRHSFHLSYGEKRKAAFATILVYNPELFILDEPTNNLDPAAKRELLEFIQRETKTVICASHDLDFLKGFCDRILIVNDGKIVADDSSDKILSDKELLLNNRLA